jgi:hypothetical protein
MEEHHVKRYRYLGFIEDNSKRIRYCQVKDTVKPSACTVQLSYFHVRKCKSGTNIRQT